MTFSKFRFTMTRGFRRFGGYVRKHVLSIVAFFKYILNSSQWNFGSQNLGSFPKAVKRADDQARNQILEQLQTKPHNYVTSLSWHTWAKFLKKFDAN